MKTLMLSFLYFLLVNINHIFQGFALISCQLSNINSISPNEPNWAPLWTSNFVHDIHANLWLGHTTILFLVIFTTCIYTLYNFCAFFFLRLFMYLLSTLPAYQHFVIFFALFCTFSDLVKLISVLIEHRSFQFLLFFFLDSYCHAHLL